jgi:hypothetical protein
MCSPGEHLAMARRAADRVVEQSILSDRIRPWLDFGLGTVNRNEHNSSPLGSARIRGSIANTPRRNT